MARTVAVPPSDRVGALPKLISCLGSGATVKVWVACAAAAQVPLPGWSAAMRQLPVVRPVTTPLAASTLGTGQVDIASTTNSSGAPVTVYVRISYAGGIKGVDGTYTLLQGGAGSDLTASAAYSLGTVFNNTSFTLDPASLNATADQITIDVTAQTALGAAFWKGGLSGAANVWAVSNGTTQSNWASDATGTLTALAVQFRNWSSVLLVMGISVFALFVAVAWLRLFPALAQRDHMVAR